MVAKQCEGKVWYLDIPRRTGRGPNGFEREWRWRFCRRKATDYEFCFQHAKKQRS